MATKEAKDEKQDLKGKKSRTSAGWVLHMVGECWTSKKFELCRARSKARFKKHQYDSTLVYKQILALMSVGQDWESPLRRWEAYMKHL